MSTEVHLCAPNQDLLLGHLIKATLPAKRSNARCAESSILEISMTLTLLSMAMLRPWIFQAQLKHPLKLTHMEVQLYR